MSETVQQTQIDKSKILKYITFLTTKGEIALELYHDHAPATCYNFSELAKQGFYNNTIFHRVIPGSIIQGGDPTGTGRGGSSIFGGQPFNDEITKTLKHVGAGILSMANSGPNTNRSQFFITLKPSPELDGKHTIFGRVFKGMKVVQEIGNSATDKNDRPVEQIKIIDTYETKINEQV